MGWISILRNRAWPEVRQTWPFVLFFAGPAVAYVLAVLAGRLLNRGAADQVRYFGTWLQLFGIVLVAQHRGRRVAFGCHRTVVAVVRHDSDKRAGRSHVDGPRSVRPYALSESFRLRHTSPSPAFHPRKAPH